MKVAEVLERKDRTVHNMDAAQTVDKAIDTMTAKGTSALIVVEEGRPVGIFTERDVLRCYVSHRGRQFSEIKLKEAMTSRLIVARSDDDVSAAMATMIKADIRHLPVVKDQDVVGMLSITDLVKSHVGALTAELHYLQEYIADLQDAIHD